MLVESLSQSAGQIGREIVDEGLACWQAQILHLRHGGIRILANIDDQAQPQRLSAVIGGYGGSSLCCITSGGEVVRHKSSPQGGNCSGAQPDSQSSRRSLKKRATILFIHLHEPRKTSNLP